MAEFSDPFHVLLLLLLPTSLHRTYYLTSGQLQPPSCLLSVDTFSLAVGRA